MRAVLTRWLSGCHAREVSGKVNEAMGKSHWGLSIVKVSELG